MLRYHAAQHDAMRHTVVRHNAEKCMVLVHAYSVYRFNNSGVVYTSKSRSVFLLSMEESFGNPVTRSLTEGLHLSIIVTT